MPETALSVYPLVGISLSASKTDDRFYLCNTERKCEISHFVIVFVCVMKVLGVYKSGKMASVYPTPDVKVSIFLLG